MAERDVARIHERLDEICERLTILETYRQIESQRQAEDRWLRRAIIQAGLAIAAGVIVALLVAFLV